MVHWKNTKSKPKCQAMSQEATHKISKQLDYFWAFYEGLNEAISQMYTCSNTLGQKYFPTKHNLWIHDHKKVDSMRIILQNIGTNLDEFCICYDFLKFDENMK